MRSYKKDLKRMARLIRKMQKAKVLNRKQEITERPTWGKRFRAVSRLRYECQQ